MQIDAEKMEEMVRKILREKPEIIISVLKDNPEFLRQIVSEALPPNVATKDDIKLLIEMFNKRFEDLQRYMDRRFEDMQKYTDKRFEDMTKRLDFIQRIIIFLLGVNIVNTSTLILILLKIFNVI